MNRVAKVLSQISDDMLMHYGVARRSGRYPWGSGDNPYQHSGDFLSRVQSLKKSGMSETDIAKTMGLTTTQLRTQMSLAKDERRAVQVATAKDLREKGYSLNEIADKMGFANDSSVRSLLNENSEARMNQAKATADVLRKLIDEKGMIDVGTGVERELGVSKEKLNQALYILEMEGYPIYGGGVPQVTNPGKQTNIKVICPPGTDHKDIYNYEDVHSVKDYISYDGGESFRKGFEYPSSMDSNRLAIRYKEDGGINKDGVIELRRGVQDLSLGDSHYAQVRIMVDGKKYLKGMVVIDAQKHKLDYKQSEIDNDIATLKKKYQGTTDSNGHYHEGASTLISRAKSETSVLKRKGSPTINEDGSLSYKEIKETYTDKDGKIKIRTQKSTKMAEVKDARELSSGTPQEEAYAKYANSMKSLANQARMEMVNTGKIAYSASAKATYQSEVDSLMGKLNVALMNAPRERQAQTIANAEVQSKKRDNPDMTKAEIKKASQQALSKARNSVGAKRTSIDITDKEWEAIQAGAISENKLTQILNNTNIDVVRQKATPRATTSLSTAKQNRISALSASGYSTSEIAEALGVSTSTVSKYLNGKE